MRFAHQLLVAISAFGLIQLGNAPAHACSNQGTSEWIQVEWSLAAPPDGPVIMVLSSSDEGDAPLPIDGDTVEVTVRNPDGVALVGELGTLPTPTTASKRFIWTPAVPLSDGAGYAVWLAGNADGSFGFEWALTVGGAESIASPAAEAGSAVERRVDAGEEVCCTAVQDDEACYDHCGHDLPDCRLCWFESWAYPIYLELKVRSTAHTYSGYFDYRFYALHPDGTEELTHTYVKDEASSVLLRFPEDSSGPYCGFVEAYDVVNDVSERSEVVCVEAADVVVSPDHDARDNGAVIARCRAGEGEDASTTDAGDEGAGCGHANGAGTDGNLLFAIFALLAVSAGRRAGRGQRKSATGSP